MLSARDRQGIWSMRRGRSRVTTAVWAALALAPALLHADSASPASVRVGLVEAESRVDEVLSRAGRQASYVVFAAAVDLRIYIESFRLAAGAALDGPPASLTPPQQQLIRSIEQAAGLLEQAADQPVAKVRATLKGITGLTDEALLAAGAGQVLAAGPAVMSPPHGDEVYFTVRGADLEHAKPRLFVGPTEARLFTVSPKQAVFAIQAKTLTFQDAQPAVRSARLMLAVRECNLKLFCHNTVREYPVELLLLPAQLANISVSYNRKVKQRVYEASDAPHGSDSPPGDKVYSRALELSSDDLTLMRCNTQNQAPHASGYQIDTASLVLSVRSSAGETRSRLTNVTAAGFGVELCAQAQIHRLAKTPGAIAVNVTWKEYRMDDVVLPAEQLPVQVLRWDTPIVATLPPDTSSISVQVDYFDGSHVTYTGDTLDDYLELRWDAAHGQLHLAARDTANIDGID